MRRDEAYSMVNWYPYPSDLVVRGGRTAHREDAGAVITSMMVYNYGTSSKLLVTASTEMYDVTASGTTFPAAAQSSLTANKPWKGVNIATSGGNYIWMANGANAPRHWDGSTWTQPTITGVTNTTLIHPVLHNKRIFCIEVNTLKIWYLDTGAIAGTVNVLDCRQLAGKGGTIVGIGSLTMDGGDGTDDKFVAVTSKGQVLVWTGLDPASSATWSLTGVYNIPEPIDNGCLTKLGGDLLILTKEGILPMSKAFEYTSPDTMLTSQIQGAMLEAAQLYSGNVGWDICHYPKEGALILNVPVAAGKQLQYVMNLATGAWTLFDGWSGRCFAVMGGALYQGGEDDVWKVWTGTADNITNASATGDYITASCLMAFNDFGTAAMKDFRMTRATFLATVTPETLEVGVAVDYNLAPIASEVTVSGAVGGTWDGAQWDNDPWGGGYAVTTRWVSVLAVGTVAAPYVKVRSRTAVVRWPASQFLWEVGGMV